MGKYLKIPTRDRGKGEFVFCNKCNQTITEQCGKSSKRISTCKFGEQHFFKARYHVKGTNSTRISKVFETKDYYEFQTEKIEFFRTLDRMDVRIENVHQVREKMGLIKTKAKSLVEDSQAAKMKKVVEENTVKPMKFKAVVQLYLDYMADVDVPAYKKKNYSDDYLADLLTAFKEFAIAVGEKLNIDPKNLLITEVGEREVGAFHEWLEEQVKPDGTPRIGNRTYNKRMAYVRKLFRYLNEKKNYDLKDPFVGVKEKTTVQDPKSMNYDQFDELIKNITPLKGKYLKSDRGTLRSLNHYRDWLKDAFKLALETGERRDGVALLRWSDINIKSLVINIRNHKVSNIKKVEVMRRIPITVSLRKLLVSMKYNKYKNSDEYVIAPEMKTRKTVMNMMSKAFTHFWKLTGLEGQFQFKHLRKTYVTTMYNSLGKDTSQVTGQSIDTIVGNYLDKEMILSEATKFDLRELNNTMNKKK